MHRTVWFWFAASFPSALLAAHPSGAHGHGSVCPPTYGTTHIHARYGEGYVHAPTGAGGIGAVANQGEEARALGRSKFSGAYWKSGQGASNSRPNLNPGSYRSDGPYYGFGSLNFGPAGTGLFGNGSNQSSYGASGQSGFGYGNNGGFRGGMRYGGLGGYGLGGYGYGGYGSGGYGYGGYGYGGYGYGYGSSGALGYGNPHSQFYFGASPINDPSTFRYGGRSSVPQVPPFENFSRPSGLVPYSYIYVNPRTPREPPNPQRIANPFVNEGGDGTALQQVPLSDAAPKPAAD